MGADQLLGGDVPLGAVEREPVAHVQRIACPGPVLGCGGRQPVSQPQNVGVLIEDGLLVAQPDLGDPPGDRPHDLGQLRHRRQRPRGGPQRQPGAAVELHRTQTGVHPVDLVADASSLLFGHPVQRQDRVRCLLGDQPHHPLVGLGQFTLVDVPAQRDIVMDAFVEVAAVIGNCIRERRVERVQDARQLVVGPAPALPELLALTLDRAEQGLPVRLWLQQLQRHRHHRGVAAQQIRQRLRHERRREPLGQLQQPRAPGVQILATCVDRPAPGHQLLDLLPAFVGTRVQRLDVRVLGQQQLVLLAQPVGVPVGGLGVDLAPLRILITDRLGRGRPVAPLLTLRGDVVGGPPRALVGVLGGGQVDGQGVDLRGHVALVQVVRLFERTPVVLDRQPVGILVQAGVGDRAAEPREHVRGVDTQVIAGRAHDVGGLRRARMGRVDDEELARQRVRFQRRGLGAQRPDPHVMQRQPSPHVGLVDEPQHRRPVFVGHQQPQADPAQHLLHRDAPAGLVGAQVHQLGYIRQSRRVDPDGRADLVAHRQRELRQCRTDLLDAAQLLRGVVARDAGGLLGVLGVGRGLPVAFHPGQQLGGLGEQLLTQIPELLGAAGHLQPLREDEVLVGAAPTRHLFGLGLGGGDL